MMHLTFEHRSNTETSERHRPYRETELGPSAERLSYPTREPKGRAVARRASIGCPGFTAWHNLLLAVLSHP